MSDCSTEEFTRASHHFREPTKEQAFELHNLRQAISAIEHPEQTCTLTKEEAVRAILFDMEMRPLSIYL